MVRVERAGLVDMAGVYRVCLLTGHVGGDATALLPDPDLLGHAYAGPYLARGSGTQLVVVDDRGIAGYLLSADDSATFAAWAEDRWWPTLRARYPLTREDSLAGRIIRFIHRPDRPSQDVLAEYPAHFHIDLLERARGAGLGRALLEQLLEELRAREVPGVHMGVAGRNTNAVGFYEHLGFRTLVREPWGVTMGMRLR